MGTVIWDYGKEWKQDRQLLRRRTTTPEVVNYPLTVCRVQMSAKAEGPNAKRCNEHSPSHYLLSVTLAPHGYNNRK